MKALNYGSLNYDYVYKVDHIVRPGETQASSDMQTFCGGKGLNQSIALAKAGVKVYHAGLIGEEGQMFLDACDMKKISIFLMNEIEGEMMTGYREPEKILDTMMERYPESKVVLTLGKDGVIYRDKVQTCSQEIFKVKAVDTTAAGDTFTGYFIAGLLEGMEMPQILKRASKASSIAVSREGAANSIPTADEVLV